MPAGVARRAEAEDVPAVVQLRAEMFSAMGTPGTEDTTWQGAAADWFTARLQDPSTHIVVIEVGGQIVATAMASIRDAAPSPTAPRGQDVLISNVCTLPAERGLGYGRAAFQAAMTWAATTGVRRAELMATDEGRSMYHAAEFQDVVSTAMRAVLKP